MITCDAPFCRGEQVSLGLCNAHYLRLRAYGDPYGGDKPVRSLTLHGKLWWYGWTVVESGCWEWKGPRDTKGYGRLNHDGRTIKAHQAILLDLGVVGSTGEVVLHHCDNPRCVNPEHLSWGTYAQNSADMVRRGRSLSNERHPGSKLSWDQVHWVRDNPENLSAGELGRRLGVTRTNIRDIQKNRTWKEEQNG